MKRFILLCVVPFLLTSTASQGFSEKIRANVFTSPPGDLLTGVNELDTSNLTAGTKVEFYGRTEIGDGGAGIATWNGVNWIKSFNDNVILNPKLESVGLGTVDLVFNSTDLPHVIGHSIDLIKWTPLTPNTMNSINGVTRAILPISGSRGFFRIEVEDPAQEDLDRYIPPIAQQALIADQWDQSISEAQLSPVNLFTAAAYAGQVASDCGPFLKAAHLYTMDEASGAFLDLIGDTDVPTNSPIPQASPANTRFQTARHFNGTDSYGIGTPISERAGRPFWFSVGLNFDSVSGNAGILSESSVATGAIPSGDWGWAFWRIGTKVELRVRRYNGTSQSDSVEIQGISANRNYIITGRSDGVTLHLYLHGEGETKEAHEHASLISISSGALDPSPFPLNIGWAPLSSLEANNVMNGEIGFVALGYGQIEEPLVDEINFAGVSDFEELNAKVNIKMARYNKIYGLGDSLTTERFSNPSWPERVATLKGSSWTFETSGIGGQTSTPIADRYFTYPLSNTAARVVAPWFGNNDPSNRQVVIDNYERVIQRALLGGAERVILLGLINRSGFNQQQELIDTVQGHQDFINDGLKELASLDDRVYFADLRSWFQTPTNYSNYTLTPDDLLDIAKGIVPRGLRDTPTSSSSTHLGPLGSTHLAAFVVTLIPD